MAREDNLRDWTERNQGAEPQCDPLSKNKSAGRDIGKASEAKGPNGDVRGEPGASGTVGGGTRPGSGSRGGTGGPADATE